RLGEETFRDWESRPEDIKFILDSIPTLEADISNLAGRVDYDRVGVGGHSFGAHTAQLIAGTKTSSIGGGTQSHEDDRPLAFVLISPQGRGPQLDEEAWSEFDRPALVVTGTRDGGRGGQDYTWRLDPYDLSPPGEKYLLFIENAHHGFGGITGISGMGNSGPADPNHLAYVQSTTTAFWDAYLKDEAAANELLVSKRIDELSEGEASLKNRLSLQGDQTGDSKTPNDEAPQETLPVQKQDSVWTDPSRNRDIPVRIFSSKDRAGPSPIVVFSPGGGESRDSYEYLGSGLAARGYIVVVASHPGSDREAIQSQGVRVLASTAFEDRPTDLRFIIDQLTGEGTVSDLGESRIDPRRIAVAGHCAGGTTAFAIAGMTAKRESDDALHSFVDPRAAVVVALGPQPDASSDRGDRLSFHDESWASVNVPALVVTGTRDFRWILRVRNDPDQVNRPFLGMETNERYLIEISDAQHHAFTDSDPYYPAGERDERHHEWIVESVAAFLDAQLKDDPDARERLLSGQLADETDGECRQMSIDASGEAPRLETRTTASPSEFEIAVEDGIEVTDPDSGITLVCRATYPVGAGPFPVILFSPYVRGSRNDFTPLIEQWARHGYVCLQVDPHQVHDPGAGELDHRARVRDLGILMDSFPAIEEHVPNLKGRLDATRIGVAGHLIGAHAAASLIGQKVFPQGAEEAIIMSDDRVAAAVLLSPQGRGQGLTEESWSTIDRPMLVVAGGGTASRRTGNPAQWRTEPFEFAATGKKHLLFLEDLGNRYAGLADGSEKDDAVASQVEEVTLAFWDTYLHQRSEASQTLESHPEVASK
ncbi:MAG: hypothetical protein AAF357_07295, partial [Verrucomicrobiota bacterium]